MAKRPDHLPKPKRNAMDDPKLGLYGAPWPADDKKSPSLKARVIDSADMKTTTTSQAKMATVGMWFTIYTNHPDDRDNTPPINLKLDYPSMMTVLEMIADTADGKLTSPTGVSVRGFQYSKEGKTSSEPRVIGQICVGKNADGEVCLIVSTPEYPKIVFPFRSSRWFEIVDPAGKHVDREIASRYISKGWVNAVRGLISIIHKDVYEHKAAALEKGGGSFGGNSSSAPSSYDDEDEDVFVSKKVYGNKSY